MSLAEIEKNMMSKTVCKPRLKNSMKVRMLTEIRDKFNEDRSIVSSFKITQRSNKQQKSKKVEFKGFGSSRKFFPSEKSIERKIGQLSFGSFDQTTLERIQMIEQQILKSHLSGLIENCNLIPLKLSTIFQLGEYINENFYSYLKVEKGIKELNHICKQLQACSLNFYAFCVSGLIFYQYGSFSLSIFYFDKALKVLYRSRNYAFYQLLQLLVYKTVSKIFLQIRDLKSARDMAYMYLRKSWKFKNIDEEMIAYDLLGKIELEIGNIEMSRYFHLRMCQGKHERSDIMNMSNNQLEKNQRQQLEFTVYEDIMIFVRRENPIISILENHYRSQSSEEIQQIGGVKKNLFMYTHRSPNRVLRNHRSIERKLMDEKQSSELHFIRPKDIKKMRKIVTEFSSFIFDLRRKCEIDLSRQKTKNNCNR